MRLKKVTNRRGFTPLEIIETSRCAETNRQSVPGKRFLTGFTLTELTVVTVMAAIVILSMGVVLVDSQRGWSAMYNRVYGGVVDDAYVARKTFDAVVRKSSINRELLGDGMVEVYYYNDPDTSILLDRYARFYTVDEELLVDYGEVDAAGNPQEPTSTVTLAHNVVASNFSVVGTCVQMTLTLDDGSESLTVMSSPVRHNE